MILTAHQPAYIPWLGLFHKIGLADVYIFMDEVKYSKSDFSNRNQIKHPNGSKHWLTIPLLTKGSDNISFKDLRIDNSQNWQKKHADIILNFYNKAPFIKEFPELFSFYTRKYEFLNDLTAEMLQYFLDLLQIKGEWKTMSGNNFTGYKNDLILDMCRKTGANLYVYGALGKDYADADAFEKENIKLYFQQYHHPVYQQFQGDFISHLSVLDLLFNCGPEKSRSIIFEGNLTKADLEKQFLLEER
jgi:hypothetical protein